MIPAEGTFTTCGNSSYKCNMFCEWTVCHLGGGGVMMMIIQSEDGSAEETLHKYQTGGFMD